MGLVAVCGLVLAMLVTAFFQLSMYLGGGREMRNAVDAGALSVGQKVFTDKALKVNLPDDGPSAQFKDVADKHGEIGLANINRVWGKALLAEANAEAMQADGQGGSSKQHADMLFDAAKNLSNELTAKLNDENNLYPLFEEISEQNSMRMLGGQTKAEAFKNAQFWQTSLLDRGQETNIEVSSADVMPSAASYDALGVKKNRLPGYTPIKAGGRMFCFVPFVENERSHLVSRSYFDSNTFFAKPLLGVEWGNPVPNAFAVKGETKGHAVMGQEGMAFVLANPQKSYKLSMPHTFVHVKIEDNKLTWLLNSPSAVLGGHEVTIEKEETTYESKLIFKNKSGSSTSAIAGTLLGNGVPVGKEYTDATLESALFASDSEDGSREKLEKVLVQRINQMITEPGVSFTTADLRKMLKRGIDGDGHNFYIFSPDGKTVEIGPKDYAVSKAPWLIPLIGHDPDGSEKEILSLQSDFSLFGLVQVIPDEACSPYFPPFGIMEIKVKGKWTPGSGYDGCLGRVRMEHTNDAYFWGIAGPL